MKMEHLVGAIFVCVLMPILVTLVFITERIAYRWAHATTFWKTTEMIINPDRIFMLDSFDHCQYPKKSK